MGRMGPTSRNEPDGLHGPIRTGAERLVRAVYAHSAHGSPDPMGRIEAVLEEAMGRVRRIIEKLVGG